MKFSPLKRSVTGTGHNRSSHASKLPQKRKLNPLARICLAWFNRLMGAYKKGSFAAEEACYASNRTSRDYLWNTLGFASWGMVFPIFTIIATQLVGLDQAGMFSFAFVVATLLMIVGNFGLRSYQVSDISEEHSFNDYQFQRLMSCVLMCLIGFIYLQFKAFSPEMFTMSAGLLIYRAFDAFADVYEGRLQQEDKLYLAGISQTIRSVLVLVVGALCLLITHSLSVASIGMALAAGLSFIIVSVPLALFETPRSQGIDFQSVISLFIQGTPLFVALFMYALIDNLPKFVMEGVLSYDNQLYFNALYFPAMSILLTVGFIYKPLLVRMAQAWADPNKRLRFDLFILTMLLTIVGITLASALFMDKIGLSIMSFMYGVDFGPYKELCFVMLAAGGVTAGIDFLYQIITILRHQKSVTRLYVLVFFFSLLVLILLITMTGLPGAVLGYLIVMTALLVLLVAEYVSIRVKFRKHPEKFNSQESIMAAEQIQSMGFTEEGLRPDPAVGTFRPAERPRRRSRSHRDVQ